MHPLVQLLPPSLSPDPKVTIQLLKTYLPMRAEENAGLTRMKKTTALSLSDDQE